MITHKQLTLAEVFEDCQHKFDNDKYHFLALLDEAINLDEIVPVSFVSHFHASTGRPRKYQLYPMLKALLIQRIFSIPTDTLLIVFLKYSQELRDFAVLMLFRMVPNLHVSNRIFIGLTIYVRSSCRSDRTDMPKAESGSCRHDYL